MKKEPVVAMESAHKSWFPPPTTSTRISTAKIVGVDVEEEDLEPEEGFVQRDLVDSLWTFS